MINKRFYSAACLLLIFILGVHNCTLAEVEPQIGVRVAEYKDSLTFVMKEGGIWQAGRHRGMVKAGKTYLVKGRIASESSCLFHTVVSSAPLANKDLIEKQKAEFAKLNPYILQIGEMPNKGFPDNRKIYLGTASFKTEEEALKHQEQLADKGVPSWVYREGLTLPQGTISIALQGKTLAETDEMLILRPNDSTVLNNVEFAEGFSWHGFENRSYGGELVIKFGFGNKMDVVEKIGLETLLAGVVPSEISASAPKAALQAQAVAARGEILSKIGVKHFGEGFDFCSEQHCQVYKGITKQLKKMKKSIMPTFGLVLENEDGSLLDAVYSANCGGHSSANDAVWVSEPNPHLQGVSDCVSENYKIGDLRDEKILKKYILEPPDCWCGRKAEGSSKFRWKMKIDEKKWKKIEEYLEIGKIKDILYLKRDVSGRLVSLRVEGELGSKTFLSELGIRKLMGAGSIIKSSCFLGKFKRKNGFIVSGELLGAGWGHGVGMCQTGAQARAKSGQSFAEILKVYFPGAKLRKVY